MAIFLRQLRNALMMLVLTFGAVGLAGCDDDGAFEQAGEEIDEAGENMEDQVDELEDEVD